MSDSTPVIDLVPSSTAQPEVPVNAFFKAVSHAAMYANRLSTTSGTAWGFYGGRMDGTAVADGTVTLTMSNTNYVVVLRSSLAVSVSTATTNWNNTTLYGRAYKVVTGSASATSWEDHRLGAGGILTPVVPASVGNTVLVPFFGDGSDGAATLDGASTPAWTTRVGSVYTMTRNCYCTNITMSSGVTLKAFSSIAWQIFCNGTITGADATSLIHVNGIDAVAEVGGAVSTAAGIYGGPTQGRGGSTTTGTNGAGQANSVGGTGAAGGAVGATAGGIAGTASVPADSAQGLHGAAIWPNPMTGRTIGSTLYTGGCGGGSGAGGGVGTLGGGSGSGGGVFGVFARVFAGVGKLQAKGGNGGNGTVTSGANAAGGGGAGGGAIFVTTTTVNWASLWTTDVAGGTHGNGIGTGANGGDGSAGNVFALVLA